MMTNTTATDNKDAQEPSDGDHQRETPSVADFINCHMERCGCRLLHPIGNNVSPCVPVCQSSSSEISLSRFLVSDLVREGVIKQPSILFEESRRTDSYCQETWANWVSMMAGEERFVSIWQKVGIHKAIMASVSQSIAIDKQAMEALFGFWRPATNTFTFPWGEAGFTLEDAHILTGLPVRGSEVDRKLSEEEERLQKSLANKAQHIESNEEWLTQFMGMKDINPLKHLGFLTYWLCKDVFVSSAMRWEYHTFALAVRLSLGDTISLAPSLVANIYRNLNLMTTTQLGSDEKASVGGTGKPRTFTPFSVLQCWVWERFQGLRPSMQGTISGEAWTRMSIWNGKQSNSKYKEAMEIFLNERQFTWRPYSRRLVKQLSPKWYSKESCIMAVGGSNNTVQPDYVYDFLAVVSYAELKGMSAGSYGICLEGYHPNRVARQFGFDQAIPGLTRTPVPPTVTIEVFIPAFSLDGKVKDEYVKWWKSGQISYSELLKKYLTRKERKRKSEPVAENASSSKRKSEPAVPLLVEQLLQFQREGLMKKRRPEDEDPYGQEVIDSYPEFFKLIPQKPNYEDTLKRSNLREDGKKVVFLGLWLVLLDLMEKALNRNNQTHNVAEIDRMISQAKQLSKDGFSVDHLIARLTSIHKVHLPAHQKMLLDELNGFVTIGLMKKADPYGQEAIRQYSRFFAMIPQKPHYEGILYRAEPSEAKRRKDRRDQWFSLVRLMGEALETTARTDAKRIETLTKQAEALERSGFDVRHLIARLKHAKNVNKL